MLDHEEAVQQLEGHCRRGEEVAGGDHFAMILQERQPALGRVASTPNAWQIPGDASFRNDEAELLKLSVDLGGSPIRVLIGQASDQNTNLIGDFRSAAAWPGSPTPVQTETGAVPADDGLGLHDDEDIGPAGPRAAKGRPEERSKEFNSLRLSTATFCRRARTSMAVSLRLRKKTRTAAMNERIRAQTPPCNMP